MRLQADPTVIYGLGGRLRRQPEEEAPFWRTGPLQHVHARRLAGRRRSRLPGLASLNSALRPAKTESLYYVFARRRLQPFSPAISMSTNRRGQQISAAGADEALRGQEFVTPGGSRRARGKIDATSSFIADFTRARGGRQCGRDARSRGGTESRRAAAQAHPAACDAAARRDAAAASPAREPITWAPRQSCRRWGAGHWVVL